MNYVEELRRFAPSTTIGDLNEMLLGAADKLEEAEATIDRVKALQRQYGKDATYPTTTARGKARRAVYGRVSIELGEALEGDSSEPNSQ